MFIVLVSFPAGGTIPPDDDFIMKSEHERPMNSAFFSECS